MYQFILYTHSWLRWILLLIGLIAVVRFIYAWNREKPYTRQDDLLSISLLSVFHLQLLLGLLLYFVLSPLTEAAFSNMSETMKNPTLRYWAVEHIFVMIFAVAVAQIGRIRSKKAVSDISKFKNAAIYYLMALFLVISRVPWQEAYRMFRGITY